MTALATAHHDSAVSLDNVLTVPVDALGSTLGHLSSEQEAQLARAVVLAYELEVGLLDERSNTRPAA